MYWYSIEKQNSQWSPENTNCCSTLNSQQRLNNNAQKDFTYVFSLDIHALFSVERFSKSDTCRLELMSQSKDLSTILGEQLLSAHKHTNSVQHEVVQVSNSFIYQWSAFIDSATCFPIFYALPGLHAVLFSINGKILVPYGWYKWSSKNLFLKE